MKRKYINPKLKVQTVKTEEPIANGSRISYGGETNGQPDIENQSIEEKEWEVEF